MELKCSTSVELYTRISPGLRPLILGAHCRILNLILKLKCGASGSTSLHQDFAQSAIIDLLKFLLKLLGGLFDGHTRLIT